MKERSNKLIGILLVLILLNVSFSFLSNLDYGIYSKVTIESKVNSINNYSKESFLYFYFYNIKRGIAWANIFFNMKFNKDIVVENSSNIMKNGSVLTLTVSKIEKNRNKFYKFKIVGGYDEVLNIENENKVTFWNDRVIIKIGYQNISKFPSVFNLWINLSILSHVSLLKIELSANNSRFINLSILNISCNQEINILKKEDRFASISIKRPLENTNCLFSVRVLRYNVTGNEETVGKYYVLANLCNVTVTYYKEEDELLEKIREVFLPLDSKISVYKNASSTYDNYINWSFWMRVPEFNNSKCWIEYSICTNKSNCLNNKNMSEVDCSEGKFIIYPSERTPTIFFKLLNITSSTNLVGKYKKIVNITYVVYPAILTTYFIVAEKNYTLISEEPVVILARVKICNEGLTSVGRVCYVEFLPKDILNRSSIRAFKNKKNVSYSLIKKYNFIDGNYAYIFCFNKIEKNTCIKLFYNLTPEDPNLVMGLRNMYFIGVDPSLILSASGIRIKIIEDMRGKFLLESLGDVVIYIFLAFVFLVIISKR